MEKHQIVIVAAGDGYLEEVDRLPAVAALDEAIDAARTAGYSVPEDLADASETNNTWTPYDPRTMTGGEMVHVVLVVPPNRSMRILTTHEAAARLGVTVRRVQALIADGRLQAEKHGRDWQIRQEDVDGLEKLKPGRKPRVQAPA